MLADFNNDQHPDIASVSGGFGHLDINLNNGDGTFAAPVNYDTGFVAQAVVVGHFNSDQQPDLAVACDFPSNDGVSILLGNADGTFQPFTNYNAGGQTPHSIAVGDFTGDGMQDLITANDQFANNSVSMLPGNGDGTFGTALVFTAGQQPLDVAVGDFNRDGRLDAVTADTGTPSGTGNGPIGTVTLLLGNGDGTFVASPNLTVSQPGPILATDLTGDNIPDLAVVTKSVPYNGVTIFPGLGDGTFGPRILTPTINQPSAVAFGFFNGDGYADLAVTTNNGVTVLINNGDGTYVTRYDYAVTGSPTWVAVDNFNGDSAPDLVVANSGGVSILLGNGDGTFRSAIDRSSGRRRVVRDDQRIQRRRQARPGGRERVGRYGHGIVWQWRRHVYALVPVVCDGGWTGLRQRRRFQWRRQTRSGNPHFLQRFGGLHAGDHDERGQRQIHQEGRVQDRFPPDRQHGCRFEWRR